MGYSLAGSSTVHIPLLSAHYGTLILAGFAVRTGRHPGVNVQAYPGALKPATMKSSAMVLPVS